MLPQPIANSVYTKILTLMEIKKLSLLLCNLRTHQLSPADNLVSGSDGQPLGPLV